MRSRGNSLSELWRTIADNRGLDLYCEADRLIHGQSPDPVFVRNALREICGFLAEVDMPEDWKTASLWWHGARLSDPADGLLR